ncbi:hotdog fold thioesterase [Sneathiella glossodoripedis]|uniref:hotdog fold thioesterase n=1 Tax=Sneathiella glossodoripedis TaxID=418853 RepID=UPI000AD3C602|nr:hotdog fold thioesterase [Sneathiella glossodoripedis]
MTEVSSTPSPDELAMQVARKMYEEDKASQHLGMALKEIAPGKAVMTMRVTEQMLNGHKTCHGGYIFTLADSAFAFACNSYNQNTVAQAAQINFLRPVPVGTLLRLKPRKLIEQGEPAYMMLTFLTKKTNLWLPFVGIHTQ